MGFVVELYYVFYTKISVNKGDYKWMFWVLKMQLKH